MKMKRIQAVCRSGNRADARDFKRINSFIFLQTTMFHIPINELPQNLH
jgi:hypothetical protein